MVKITHEKAVKRGKKNKKSGNDFELKVRKDLESKGWIVSKWSNNVDLEKGKLIPAKHKFNPFNKVMTIGTGFPDFITFKPAGRMVKPLIFSVGDMPMPTTFISYEVIGVEAKSNGYLTPEEKEKCKWLLDNKIFGKILIAKKGEKGEIIYINFGE